MSSTIAVSVWGSVSTSKSEVDRDRSPRRWSASRHCINLSGEREDDAKGETLSLGIVG